MSGWLILLALMGAVGALLWRFGRLPANTTALLGVTLALAAVGYGWQGSPRLSGSPARGAEDDVRRSDSPFALLRGTMMPRFGREADALMTADAFQRQGLDRYAVAILKGALEKRPNSANLWVGLAWALALHNEGMLSPAAEFAFARARAASPQGPAAPFFRGLILAQGGRFPEARAEWAALLARTPQRAPWYRDVALRVQLMDAVMQAQAAGR